MKSFYLGALLSIVTVLFTSCGGPTGPGDKEDSTKVDSPNSDIPVIEPKPIPLSDKLSKINIYVENGPSMWGYAHMGNGFGESIKQFALLCEDISGSVEYSLIGVEKKKLNSKNINLAKNICDETVFQDKEKAKGSSTYIYELIDEVADDTKSEQVAVLVSDYILSPGKQDPLKFSEDEKLSIKSIVSKGFTKKGFNSVAVFQMKSKFTGKYWYFDKDLQKEIGKEIEEDRPYYIWVIGNEKYVKQFANQDFLNAMQKGGNLLQTYFVAKSCETPKYSFATKGKYKPLSMSDKHTVNGAMKDGLPEAYFDFCVNVDMSNIPLPESYLCDTSNYEIVEMPNKKIIDNSKYKLLSVESVKSGTYTHKMHVKYETEVNLKPTTLKIKLKNKFPEWVKAANENQGREPIQGKTYGIQSIIEGLYDGMTNDGRNKDYFELTLNIKL